GSRLAVPAFGCPARSLAVLSRVLHPHRPPARHGIVSSPRRCAACLPRRDDDPRPGRGGLLWAAKTELRVARQPGAAPALARLPALCRRSGRAQACLAGPGSRRTRRPGKAAAPDRAAPAAGHRRANPPALDRQERALTWLLPSALAPAAVRSRSGKRSSW